MDLNPCPFCGGKPYFDHDDDGWTWIECDQCHVATNQRISAMEDCKPLLAEAWNRRAIPPETRTCETCGQDPCVNYSRDLAMCMRMSHWVPRAPQSADVEMVREALEQLDCTCDAEGGDSDHSYEICACYKHDAIAALDRIVACVNACAGINTTQLEMASSFGLAVQYKKEADSLRAALSEKTAQVKRLREALEDVSTQIHFLKMGICSGDVSKELELRCVDIRKICLEALAATAPDHD